MEEKASNIKGANSKNTISKQHYFISVMLSLAKSTKKESL
jgi:hypothetical protein